MSGPKVVELRQQEEWRDAVATLKAIVERIESGDIPRIIVGALVLYDDDGGLSVFGMGPKGEDLAVLSMLELGKVQIIDSIMG